MKQIAVTAILAWLVLVPAASAQTRQELIVELVRVQGVQEMFDETLAQTRAATQQYGRQMFAQIVAGADDIDPSKRKRLEVVFQEFLNRVAAMWKPDELLAMWTQSYGAELSEAELKQMITYYKSPIGTKDVAAVRSATRAFTTAFNADAQRRIQALTQQLMAELKAEAGR